MIHMSASSRRCRAFTLQQVASGYAGDSTGDDGGIRPLATSLDQMS
jgi:hypothetical protein